MLLQNKKVKIPLDDIEALQPEFIALQLYINWSLTSVNY